MAVESYMIVRNHILFILLFSYCIQVLYLDSTKYDRFPIIRSRPAIKNWSSKNMSTRQDLEIQDEVFGKLELHGEWSGNEAVEAEGFCEHDSLLPPTDKKVQLHFFYA